MKVKSTAIFYDSNQRCLYPTNQILTVHFTLKGNFDVTTVYFMMEGKQLSQREFKIWSTDAVILTGNINNFTTFNDVSVSEITRCPSSMYHEN